VRWLRQRGGGRAQAALEDRSAGQSVRKAQEALDEIARFEQE
jgi:hypothetical protein